MTQYPAYQKYKPTGCDWFPEIPAHWDIDRAKWSVTACQNGVWGSDPDGDDDLVCIRVADFDRQSLRVATEKLTMRSIAEKDRIGRLLETGDLLLEKSGGGEQQSVGAVVEFNQRFPAVSSNFIARMVPAKEIDSRFLVYVHSHLYVGHVNYRSIKQTTGIQNLDSQAYLNESIAYPPHSEQQAIARFLDFKTAQIDALIAKKQTLLKKLAEKRTALISHAVTKGLDPSVPMKDSGVEWIGEIPQHWTTRRVKFAAKLESGHTPSKQVPEYWEDCDIPWVSLNDSKQLAVADYITETAIQINSLGLANSSARLLPPNAVVFTRDATIGLCAITTRPMAVSQHLIAWIPGPDITPLYLLRVFNAMKGFLDSFTFGATIKTIGMPDVKKLAMPIPPKDEQEVITKYIDHQFRAARPQVRATEMAIAKLQEYRSAIITAAVTGKIDVRNATNPPVAQAGA